MTESITAGLLFLLLLLSSAVGLKLQGRLADRHRSAQTIDAVRLVISMLVTFTALVLGLLTSSAKTSFDEFGNRMLGYSIDMIELDQRLREYGEEANAARALLRTYVAAAIADTWRDEPRPSGSYPLNIKPVVAGSIEGEETGALMAQLDEAIRALEPTDKTHRKIADQNRWRFLGDVKPEGGVVLADAFHGDFARFLKRGDRNQRGLCEGTFVMKLNGRGAGLADREAALDRALESDDSSFT